ncbi:helix-turn-helix domain-containing protein [Sneathiella sp.]|jgi:transcriptional regulator with XRE-family HTH domain|uniref:helix-turn-helix domain-containing protein n=1 Tax=Sneathiella sp. TaxID=1964365 RepID=UPI0039E64A53
MSKVAKRVGDHVGERIRTRRTQLGLTQLQLAEALNISYQQVQKYETGANRISAGRLYELSVKLQVEISYFFGDLQIQESTPPMEHGGKGRATIELVRNYNEISDPSVRASVNSLIRALSDPNSSEMLTKEAI